MIHQTVYLLLRLCTAVAAAWMAGKYHQLREKERGAVISGAAWWSESMVCVWLGFVMLLS